MPSWRWQRLCGWVGGRAGGALRRGGWAIGSVSGVRGPPGRPYHARSRFGGMHTSAPAKAAALSSAMYRTYLRSNTDAPCGHRHGAKGASEARHGACGGGGRSQSHTPLGTPSSCTLRPVAQPHSAARIALPSGRYARIHIGCVARTAICSPGHISSNRPPADTAAKSQPPGSSSPSPPWTPAPNS